MKSVTIDELLSWAFVHELPKGGGVEGLDNPNSAWRMLQASSWGKITDWAELMTLVDTGRRDFENFLIEQGDPHDDAIAVGEAVTDLAAREIVIPDDWRPLCDWPLADARMADLIGEAVERARARWELRTPSRRRAHLVALVVGSAVLGHEPQWDAPMPKIRMVERAGQPAWFITRRMSDAFGRDADIEVDGFNRRSGRPHRGAYRKYAFSEDPVGDILARLDREMWATALMTLEMALANRLTGHRLLKWDCAAAPWGAEGERIALVAPQGAGLRKTA